MLTPASQFPSLRRVDALDPVGTCTICDPADLPPDCPLAHRTTWPLHCGRPVAVLCLGDCRCPGDPIDLRAAAYATAIAMGELTYEKLSHKNMLAVRGVVCEE
jgi:hypothetical protein